MRDSVSRSVAEIETAIWRSIRSTEKALVLVQSMETFGKAMKFVGKEIPVEMDRDTLEHLKQVLAADLVRLKQSAQ